MRDPPNLRFLTRSLNIKKTIIQTMKVNQTAGTLELKFVTFPLISSVGIILFTVYLIQVLIEWIIC